MALKVKLSFSKISTYIECPRKYFLSYIAKLGTGSSPHMSNGSAIHKCCEHYVDWPEEEQTLDNLNAYYYKILPDTDNDRLVHNLYEDGWDTETGEVKYSIIVHPTFEKKAMDALRSFYEDYTTTDYHADKNKGNGPSRKEIKPNIKLQEQWFNLKLGEPDEHGNQHEIRGLIDRVDEENPEIELSENHSAEHIIDYKSGQSRTTYKALQDALDIKSMQLSIYALARWKETGKIPYKSSFFYLEPSKGAKKQKGQYRTAPARTVEQLTKVEKFLTDMANEIAQATEDMEFPMGVSPNCFWCDFNTKCEILAKDEMAAQINLIEALKRKEKSE